MNLTTEQIGDLTTIGMLSIMWWMMSYAALRNTWEWDGLGRALTLLTITLGITSTISMAFVVLDPELWFVVIRWSFRVLLIVAGACVITTLRRANRRKQGRPP